MGIPDQTATEASGLIATYYERAFLARLEGNLNLMDFGLPENEFADWLKNFAAEHETK